MSATAEYAAYLEAIDHLPRGAALQLTDITWDEYELLLSELAERSDLRLTFDRGRLEIMSPRPEHEEYGELIQDFARVISEELDFKLETRGSATFRSSRSQRGVEADTSLYVQHAEHLIGKRDIDLDFDPPPDVIVEIDLTHRSIGKLPVYAALGVPEIWIYDNRSITILHLEGQEYAERANSLAFPILTGEVLARFLEVNKTEGQSVALSQFRSWVKTAVR
jgi:Uma2 family endonuclease